MTDTTKQTLFHFEVSGPGRDYDYTTFCQDHGDQACAHACEWLTEVWDGLDVPADEGSVTLATRPGTAERCYECNPTRPGDYQ